jgi:hypothetical protein
MAVKSKKNTPIIHEVAPGKYVGVIAGKSIRLYGVDKNRYVRDPHTGKRVPGEVHYDVTYEVGDEAEWDSFNWSYIGRIVSIGAKTVTIEPGAGEKKRRLSLAEFSRRNDIGTVAEKRAHAREEMMYH